MGAFAMKLLVATLAILLNIITSNITISAQDHTLGSYRKAREIVDRSIGAHGGADKIRSIDNFTIKASGYLVLRHQSRKPFILERAPRQIDITVDLKNDRFLEEERAEFASGNKPHESLIVNNKEGVSIDHVRRTRFDRTNIPPAELRSRLRWLPQFILLNAIERASGLRYVGTSVFESRPHDVVIFGDAGSSEQTTLFFDQKTMLLSKYETLGSDPVVGDAVTETSFYNYKKENDLPVPHARKIRIAGELTDELRFDKVELNHVLNGDKFKVPDGLRMVTFPAPPSFIKLSENAYVINVSGYNILAVGFTDHILVMEAPLDDSVSMEAIERVKKLFPGRPIRYLAATHHHEDHTGGIRTYIAEGAALVVAPGQRAYFESLAKSSFTLRPDTLVRQPRPVKVETVIGGKRVFADDRAAVEIYDIGSNTHSDEMLVAYLPNEKALYTADMLNRPPNGDAVLGNLLTLNLEKWIIAKKFPVEKIIPVHGTVTSISELRRANSDFQQEQKK
jgi:glyoxylase-like metal-dependent hydrolase (beta-lactamase superfamily II)